MRNTFPRQALLALTLAGAALNALAADFTLRISHQLPPSHQVAKAVDQLAADVQEGSKGRIEVQVFGSEQLYKVNQNHAAVARGQVEAAVIESISWGQTLPEMSISSVPYLIVRPTQLRKFPSSDIGKLLQAKMLAKGVLNLAWMVDANDILLSSNKVPLIKPADFVGVKLRGFNKIVDTGFSALGALPISMPGSEVYQALQSGVIDAAGTGVGAAYTRRFYEVQKYGVASAFQTVFANLVVNPVWWSKLPPDLQAVVTNAARKAEAKLMPDSPDVAPEDVQRLRDKGMKVTVLTPAQEKVLADIMQPPVIKAFAETTPDGAALVELARKL